MAPNCSRKIAHKLLILCCLGSILVFIGTAWGYSGGPPDGYAGDPPNNQNCTFCHTGNPLNSSPGIFMLIALPTYVPDSTYVFLLSLNRDGQSRWGFELTSILGDGTQGGTLTSIMTGLTQLSAGAGDARDYLKHTLAGSFQGMTTGAAWSFGWTAPPAGSGPVTFYAAGNAANNSGTNAGDYIYTTTWLIEEATGVQDSPAQQPTSPMLLSAYPNPFNPTINLNLSSLPPGQLVNLQVLDLSGRLLKTIVLPSQGNTAQQFPLDLEFLPSGRYFLQANSPSGSAKLIVIKAK